MTDRELLELAAKAAGIKVKGKFEDEPTLLIKPGLGLPPARWNPLADDGDALRLAVKLKINIEHMETLSRKPHGINCWPVGRGECAGMELDLSDPYAATRRAIVRTASEIGKEMK